MKKILTLVTLLGAFVMGANAQRSIHVVSVGNVSNGDTLVVDSVNQVQLLFQFGFVNAGPNDGMEGDSIKWRTAYNASYYYVLQAGDAFASGDTLGYFNDTVSLATGPVSGTYNWCDSAVLLAGGTNSVITDPAPQEYCESVYILNRNGAATGLFTPGLNKVAFTLYPNPAHDVVNFSYTFTKASDVNVRVMDLTGRTLSTNSFGRANAGTRNFNIDVANLPAGTYMLEMTTGVDRGVAKFTKN